MNNNNQSKFNAGRVRSLGLLDKTLPLTAATPPQLRNRRQFQFNGMHFETNPLSLHMARGGLDGDAGDARFPSSPQEWRDPPYRAYKTSPSSAASRVTPPRGSVSPGNENGSFRAAPQPTATHPLPQQLQQPDERTAWRGDADDNNQAGGEDAYNSNSYNMNNNSNGYNTNNNSNSYNMNNRNNNNMDNMNTHHLDNTSNQQHNSNTDNQHYNSSSSSNNNNNNSHHQSKYKNNTHNSGGVMNNDRFHQVLAKYSRQPLADDNNMNNSNSINVNSSNNLLSSNSYKSSFESEHRNDDDQMSDHYAKEEMQIPSRMYNRPLKLTGFRYGQMRAGGGGGFNAVTVTPSKMDYITLTGFLLGYLTSNMLFFLCWYFSWLKRQVVKLRHHFLGHTNLWEFFDFEDTTRYSMQTKLLLAPIILGCSILYCIVNILHILIKLVRSDVPRTVVDFVQRIAKSHWS